MLAVVAAFVLSMLSDSQMTASSFWRHVPGYGALLLHSMTSSALDHTLGVLSPSLGNAFTLAAATLGASVFALPFYMFRTFLVRIFGHLSIYFPAHHVSARFSFNPRTSFGFFSCHSSHCILCTLVISSHSTLPQ
jgi:hypothetical protein